MVNNNFSISNFVQFSMNSRQLFLMIRIINGASVILVKKDFLHKALLITLLLAMHH